MEHKECPKVSIIIPFFNCKYISRAISSAIKQTYPNIEVIVVDDGSTQYLSKLKPFRDKIIYIRKKNGGTASALNEGIRNTNGDYIVWLSSDDLFFENKVETQLNFMNSQNYLFSYTDYFCINEKNRIISDSIGPLNFSTEELLKSLRIGCPINGSTIMMQREVIDSVGLFDESLIYANDYDYWIRVFLQYEIGYLNKPLTLYRIHRNMGTKLYTYDVLNESEKVKLQYKKDLDQFK
ncbi:glycosyltransferase [Cytobacillus oceanisediminis]|uniref:glycosyltransferase n=1 Tax=Cytobacillus oceanisediminis TaxID=665099 RepID=UPI002079B8EB|nr:glycosyltransferase [Cytobacillus oceanisediminis]USK46565.1 glycosyltransferase [Cytobacillus oceanisediminis]